MYNCSLCHRFETFEVRFYMFEKFSWEFAGVVMGIPRTVTRFFGSGAIIVVGLLAAFIAIISGDTKKSLLIFFLHIAWVLVFEIFLAHVPHHGVFQPDRAQTLVLFFVHVLFVFLVVIRFTLGMRKHEECLKKEVVALQSSYQREAISYEQLLGNMFPKAVVERLKRHEQVVDSFEDVTVLFADFVGFTPISSRVSPTELVDLLNVIFSSFDTLCEVHDLEKIKTIGDACMAVAGVPYSRIDHASAAANMALDMMQEIKKFGHMLSEPLNVRIGISSGPVVVGSIGKKKGIYDVWGDTVNVAARMEYHGMAGEIQISENTFIQIQHAFEIIPRGNINVKGKGEMFTYILRGRPTEMTNSAANGGEYEVPLFSEYGMCHSSVAQIH